MAKVLLVVLIYVSLAAGQNISISRYSDSNDLVYDAVVFGNCSISWTGVAGVWKTNSWTGNCSSYAPYGDLVTSLMGSPRFTLPRNASSFVRVVGFDAANNSYVGDTRVSVNPKWDSMLQELISSFDLLLDNATWAIPDGDVGISAFGPRAISWVQITGESVGKLTLFANFTGVWVKPDPTQVPLHAQLKGFIWQQIIMAATNASFYGVEQYPIVTSSSNAYSVCVCYNGDIVQNISFPTLTSMPRKVPLLWSYYEALTRDTRVVWMDPPITSDHGKTLAIALSTVFGVFTLVLILVAAWKFNHKSIPKVPERALEHAIHLYNESDVSEDERE